MWQAVRHQEFLMRAHGFVRSRETCLSVESLFGRRWRDSMVFE